MSTTTKTFAERTPAPPELLARASALVEKYPGCFWFRHPDARIRYLDDVRLVVQRLREYGGWKEWEDAQELQTCLSRNFNEKSWQSW
ncbi:MAG: hypothetical protein ACKO2G_16925 [Verrucomicrobiales bacterium]